MNAMSQDLIASLCAVPGKIQFPLSAQTLPAFLYGLFAKSRKHDIHPWSMSAGAIVAFIYIFVIYFGYLAKVEGAKPINAGVTGLIINVAVVVSTELVRRTMPSNTRSATSAEEDNDEHPELLFADRPKWDLPQLGRFGPGALSPERIWNLMDGVNEPMANWWWVVLFFLAVTIPSPMTPENEPPMENGSFLFPVALINGLPWWYSKMLWLSTIATIILLVAIFNMPSEFPGAPVQKKHLSKKESTMSIDSSDDKELAHQSSTDEDEKELTVI